MRTLQHSAQEIFLFLVDDHYWSSIAKFRRFLQRIPNSRLIFLDETVIYGVMLPRRTLVAPDYQPYILVNKPSAYAERYDFIRAINGSEPIACKTWSPEDRAIRGVKGVRKEAVNEWIVNDLAPSINRLGDNDIYLVCDKSRAHNRLDMLQALNAGHCGSVVDVLFMPSVSAKYVSPLDNLIWHSIKEAARKHHPLRRDDIPEVLSRTFFELSKEEICNAYRKCAISAKTNVYYDKPSL